MKKTKILTVLSFSAICSTALLSCNSNTHGTRDVPAIHILNSNQKVGFFNPFEGTEGQWEWDINGAADILKKSYNQLSPEDQKTYYNEYSLLMQNINEGYTLTNYNSSNLLEYKPAANSVIEYGKDLDIEIYPKNPFVLLANVGLEGEEGKEFIDLRHNPYNNAGNYAIPYVGYGNALKPHAWPLASEYYSYKQDEIDNQKFHLHVDGSAFNHNLVIDYGYSSYDKKYDNNNFIAVISSPFSISKDDTKGANDFYVIDDNLSKNKTPLNSDGSGYSEGFKIKITPNLITTINDDFSEIAKSDYETKGTSVNFHTYRDPQYKVEEETLFKFDGLKVGTDATAHEDYRVYGVKDDKKTEVDFKNVTSSISSYDGSMTITIPWEEIHDFEKTSGRTVPLKYNKHVIKFYNEPKHLVDVTVSQPTSPKATIVDKGYGHYDSVGFGSEANQKFDSSQIIKALYHNEESGEDVVLNRGTYRMYRTIVKMPQLDSKTTPDATITWPNVEIVHNTKLGNTYTEEWEEDTSSTNWRSEYFKKLGKEGEGELRYKLTKDSNGYCRFAMVCLNSNDAYVKNDHRTKDINGVDIPDAGQHNLFAIYDLIGYESYKTPISYELDTSLSINVK